MQELLTSLWRNKDGNHKCIVAMKGRAVKHFFLRDPSQAQLAAEQLSDGGWDVYFAPSQFDPEAVASLKAQVNPATGRTYSGRSQRAVAQVEAFWLDIDCGPGTPYSSWQRGMLALLQWGKQAQFPNPNVIVRSGSGLHVYWLLDAGYPLAAWRPVAQHFKQALSVGGVHADPVRTADAASILRIPGTKNWKNRQNPRPVEVVHRGGRRLSLAEFSDALPRVGPIRAVGSASVPDEWGTTPTYPAGDAEGIADKCGQMAQMRERRGALSEPLWRAGLSVLARCDKAEHYIHEWSKGDERYSEVETQRKADGTGGPATCDYFAAVNPEGCAGCPHAGKVTSPVQLALAAATAPGGDDSASPSPAVRNGLEEDWRPTTVNSFKITDAGIYWQAPAKEGEAPELVRITECPVWVSEVRERAREDLESDSSSLVIEWRGVDGRERRALLRQAHAHDMRSFTAWLADHNLIAMVHEVKLLVRYISQYTLKMLKSRGAREYHDRLGWHRDGFVVGDRIISKEGSREALVQSTSPIAHIKPQGSVAEWSKAANLLGQEGYEKHAFALLCGFGSPILSLAGVQSAVVSLAGVSGAGKTLAARAALSIYGQPQHLMQGAVATPTGVEIQLGTHRHVPFLLDEVTDMPVHRLTDFIYLAANGVGKGAATRNREMRETGRWQLTPFVSSNRPLLEFRDRDVQEAHRRRLLELFFPSEMPRALGAQLHSGIEANAGSPAEPYFKALCAIKDDIPDMYERVREWVLRQAKLPDANRFALWTITAAIVGGTIAKALGLIDFDPKRVALVALRAVEDAALATEHDHERAPQAVKEWLAQESQRVCRWQENTRGAAAVGELVDDPIARVLGNGRVVLHKRAFQEMLQEERISRHALTDWLAAANAKDRTMRLAPGTPTVRAVELDAAAVGLDENEGGA